MLIPTYEEIQAIVEEQRTIIQIKDTQIAQLQAQIGQLQFENEKLRSQIGQLQFENEDVHLENTELKGRVKVLEDKLSQDSHNSHKPPSTDGFRREVTSSLREPSDKKVGGQLGHKPDTLKMVDNPQRVVRHKVEQCHSCKRDLQEGAVIDIKRRQVFDIPSLVIEVTEHQAEVKQCGYCGTINEAKFPEGVNNPVEYGAGVKSLMVYLNNYQLLPYERTCEIFRDLFSHQISVGTLYNTNRLCYEKLKPTEDIIKEGVIDSRVVHFDETGIYSQDQRQWLHVASTGRLTYYGISEKRGKEGIQQVGVLPEYKGTAVHDHWRGYNGYKCKHAFCNAHHLRELLFAYEQEGQEWAKKMKECLLEIKEAVDNARRNNQDSLAPTIIEGFEERYEGILREGLKMYPVESQSLEDKGSPPKCYGRKKQSKSKNLLDRLLANKRETLAFMYDFAIPFDNNLAERDIRMAKVKQKISGCFRSQKGAEFFCRIRGYISTVRKQEQDVIKAISDVFKGNQVIPVLDSR